MRWISTAAFTVALLTSVTAPAWAQDPQIGLDFDGALVDIFRGEVITGDFISYPEEVIGEQYLLAEETYERLLNERFASEPPIVNRDLPNPYSTSVLNLPGYYRVTLTQPTLD